MQIWALISRALERVGRQGLVTMDPGMLLCHLLSEQYPIQTGFTLCCRLLLICAGAQIGDLISRALERVGRQGVVTMEESRTAEDHMYVVEGMQFDRGYISPYFVTDPERMVPSPALPRCWPGFQLMLDLPAGMLCTRTVEMLFSDCKAGRTVEMLLNAPE